MPLKPLLAVCALLLSSFVAGCTTVTGDCSGEAAAGDTGAGYGSATGDGSYAMAAGSNGGEAYAAGSCGDCTGVARAGPGYAEASGSCFGCEGTASAGSGEASSSGSCYGCTGEASAGGSSSRAGGNDAAAVADGSDMQGAAVAADASRSCLSVPTKDVSVYSFAGMVTGASAPDPMGSGGLAPTPIAKEDSFVLPNGTLSMMFTSGFSGSGSGRIEVYGPDNSLVYNSFDYYCAGGVVVSGCTMQGSESQTDLVVPGTYVVHYLLAGTADMSLDVVATVLVPASVTVTATERAAR